MLANYKSWEVNVTIKALLTSAICSTFLIANVGLAQETNTTETATEETAEAAEGTDAAGFNLGEEVAPEPKVGEPYAKEVFGDWIIQCIKSEGEKEPCNMFQLLRDGDGNAVAEVTIMPLKNQGQVVAGGNFIAPLGTLLTSQMSIQVDEGSTKRYPFTFCTAQGCVARVGFAQSDLNAYKRGNSAKVLLVPASSPDKRIVVAASLTGFTAAFNYLSER